MWKNCLPACSPSTTRLAPVPSARVWGCTCPWIRIGSLPIEALHSAGAIHASGWNYVDGGTIAQMYYEGLAAHYHFSLDTPVKDLPKEIVDILLYGTKGEKIKLVRQKEYGRGEYFTEFEGVLNNLQRRYKETTSDWMREELEAYMSEVPCPECHGRAVAQGEPGGDGRGDQHLRAVL